MVIVPGRMDSSAAEMTIRNHRHKRDAYRGRIAIWQVTLPQPMVRRRATYEWIVFCSLLLAQGSAPIGTSTTADALQLPIGPRRSFQRVLWASPSDSVQPHAESSGFQLQHDHHQAPPPSFSRRQSPSAAKKHGSGVIPYEKQITNLGRLGNIDQALQLFSSLESPTLRQVNAILDACARANPPRTKTSLEIFHSNCGAATAKQGGHGGSGSRPLRPNVYTFGALMSGCARAGNVALAMRLLVDVESVYDVPPNTVVYHSAITACARAVPPRVDLALQLLRRAREEGVSITVIGYNAAVAAAARAADTATALQLLHEMEDHEPSRSDLSTATLSRRNSTSFDAIPRADAVTYATVLAACETSKEWELCLQVAERMRSRGYVFDGMAYTSVLHACQQLGLAQQAMDYLGMMKREVSSYQRRTAGRELATSLPDLKGPDDVAYRLVISACARGRAVKEAIQVLDEFCSQHPSGGDVMAFTAAITACDYVGDWKTAFSLLDRMKKSGIQPNEVTFAAVIGACATALASTDVNSIDRRGSTAMPTPLLKAMQLLQVLKREESCPGPNIQVYNAAIRACAEAMDVNNAFKLVRDLREEGLEPTIVTYGCLMTACERVGSATAASKVFKAIREDGFEPNEIIYGAAISCCRKAGERERALLLLKKMIREGQKPNIAVFHTVLMAQIEGASSDQDIENALLTYKILRQFPDASPNRQTYNILIRALATQKQPRQAEKLLNDMQEDGLVPDVDLFTATVSSYERVGQPLKALGLMESMTTKGYDFYEPAVLNTAFKKAVKLVNAVGRGLVAPDEVDESSSTGILGLKSETR